MKLSRLSILVAFLLLASGCAIGPTVVKVEHEPLKKITNKREGKVAVTTFSDKREEGHQEHIGNKRNSYGMVLGWIDSNGPIEEILTKYFAEALREAGYEVSTVTVLPEDRSEYDAIIEGDILEFWMDLYMMVWHDVSVRIRVLDGETMTTLLQKEFTGEETNALWLGVVSEYEAVISQALTKALNMAVDEFSSEEFYKAVKERADSAE